VSQASDELVRRRRDMVARRRELKAELTKLASDITAIDRVLLLLDPAYKPEAARVTPPRLKSTTNPFAHGEMTPAALEALRLRGKPATSAEVAATMLERKGLAPDGTCHPGLAAKVTSVFIAKAEAGQIRRVGNGDSRQVLREVAR